MSYVYILCNRSYGILYIGVTKDLVARMRQHRAMNIESFTKKYNVTRLVYYEQYERINEAIQREKHLKNWKRAWKLKLISRHNPLWTDLITTEAL